VDTAILVHSWLHDITDAQGDRTNNIGRYMQNGYLLGRILHRVALFISLKYQSRKYRKTLETIAASLYYKDIHTVRVGKLNYDLGFTINVNAEHVMEFKFK